ncbi:MAG: TlpA disulfide reductase family protein [Phycisphaerales bacterium]
MAPSTAPARTIALALSLALAAGLAHRAGAQSIHITPADKPPAAQTDKPAKPEPTLKVGSPAPAFQVESFVKGEQFSSFEKGRVYVVEFWATWCGPCIIGMPHLSSLQKEFGPKGVTIVGINVWEEPEYKPETLAKVQSFVQKKGDTMAYTVAFDGKAMVMGESWMKAAGRNSIPTAFVVDATGAIAWIGHPSHLDMVLDAVTSGKWDNATGPDLLKSAHKEVTDALARYNDGVQAGDQAWKNAEAKYPFVARTMHDDRYAAVIKAGHYQAGYALGRELLEEGKAHNDPSLISSVLTPMLDGEHPPKEIDRALALDAGREAFERADQSSPGAHIGIAQVHFLLGEIDKGKAACAKAVELAPENLKERYRTWGQELEGKARPK